MATGPAAEIDQLFQLPLREFTSARNALAKRAGKAGGDIRALTKPPLAAWAVNQLYWQDRDRYEDLIRAATDMRRTHKAVIEGKRGDLRSASREHDLALDAALKSTIAILEASGNPVTDATRQAIVNTLRALPSQDPPGRLTRTLTPGGFEMLAGISASASPKADGSGAAASARRAESGSDFTAAGSSAAGSGKDSAARKKEQEAARLREQRAAAERAIRDADREARHAEFEAARAKRDATRAEHRLDQARRAFEEAKTELEAAEQEAARTLEAMHQADRRSDEAHARLEQARAQKLT